MAELLAEAKYYCISELAESCEQALLKKERDAEPICRVPLITSQKEEQLLISSTSKVMRFEVLVAVKLLMLIFWVAVPCTLKMEQYAPPTCWYQPTSSYCGTVQNTNDDSQRYVWMGKLVCSIDCMFRVWNESVYYTAHLGNA